MHRKNSNYFIFAVFLDLKNVDCFFDFHFLFNDH
jgi:hypothetical protein